MAGNTLLGGGDFGEELDLATFEVQERMDASISAETLSFDLFQSHLLPGFQHTFSFDVTDGNGIDSEVRRRIKNLEEGTRGWEIAYQQTLERINRLKGEI